MGPYSGRKSRYRIVHHLFPRQTEILLIPYVVNVNTVIGPLRTPPLRTLFRVRSGFFVILAKTTFSRSKWQFCPERFRISHNLSEKTGNVNIPDIWTIFHISRYLAFLVQRQIYCLFPHYYKKALALTLATRWKQPKTTQKVHFEGYLATSGVMCGI